MPNSSVVTRNGGTMYPDLHIIDWHAHFPIPGDVSQGGGKRSREIGRIDNPAAVERQKFREGQLAKSRQQWRLAFDFPEPETEPRSSGEQASRWADALATIPDLPETDHQGHRPHRDPGVIEAAMVEIDGG
jgi:hypothetical protein